MPVRHQHTDCRTNDKTGKNIGKVMFAGPHAQVTNRSRNNDSRRPNHRLPVGIGVVIAPDFGCCETGCRRQRRMAGKKGTPRVLLQFQGKRRIGIVIERAGPANQFFAERRDGSTQQEGFERNKAYLPCITPDVVVEQEQTRYRHR